ncbi:hypothetical protein [Actinomadura livida]|uniref:PLD phosphodiesterase domain-containing protein n=1 Tax=Actinomadura livida TaxID=79909 RepID=A0A7W7N2C7_9ACTN|nr:MULTISPECIES: hypothetical protein [Actinomadura]MBB4778850.1 hypothetical protein [Actinomadura catellatispora]GGU26240.1 hypothetical protein GCM10010208_58730 [Actinomadura livida]
MTESTVPAQLVVPELLQGPWSSLVILTFGAELGFFENRLLSQLSQVPLRVILADGEQLGAKLAEAAATGQRWKRANRTYVAGPIRHQRSAHAKVIMLTAEQEGLLVVGSGNLGHDGYASSGELWSIFRYHDERPGHLPEFVAARSLIDGMARRDLLDPPVVELLGDVWGTAPWMPAKGAVDTLVQHNLARPLIEQLADRVTWPVHELVAYAPFHDPECAALAELIAKFSPAKVTALVSKGTSVDPEHLNSVLSRAGAASTEAITVEGHATTYIHAKWVHLLGQDREVLLSGSANLSRSALLQTAETGNIEVGLIRESAKGGFASIYEHLVRTPVADVGELGLRIQPSTKKEIVQPGHPILWWSRLDGKALTLVFDRVVHEPHAGLELSVTTGGVGLEHAAIQFDGTSVKLQLTAQSAAMVTEGGAVEVHFGGDEDTASHAWPYQLAQLRGRLERADRRENLARIGRLPDKEAELIELLHELEQSLIIDAATAWRVVKPTVPPPETDGEGASISWDDLDWDRVRRDPRYTGSLPRSHGTAPTDIQLILAAISGRLGELGVFPPTLDSDDDESDLAREGGTESADKAEENEDDMEDEVTRQTLSISTKGRMALNRFIRRYALATRDDRFIEEMGPLVAATNAAIFSNLLEQLAEMDHADAHRIVEAQLSLWELLWGSPTGRGGVLDTAAEDEKAEIAARLSEAGVQAAAMRAMVWIYDQDLDEALSSAIRDQLRHLIVDHTFGLDEQLLQALDPQGSRTPTMLAVLAKIARTSSQREREECILSPLKVSRFAATWEVADVRRSRAGRITNLETDVLVVREHVFALNSDKVRAALGRLAVARRLAGLDHSYLRIRFAGNGRDVGIWDEGGDEWKLLIQIGDEQIEGLALDPPWPDWLFVLDELQDWADARRPTRVVA